jgi:hypothetical protein
MLRWGFPLSTEERAALNRLRKEIREIRKEKDFRWVPALGAWMARAPCPLPGLDRMDPDDAGLFPDPSVLLSVLSFRRTTST